MASSAALGEHLREQGYSAFWQKGAIRSSWVCCCPGNVERNEFVLASWTVLDSVLAGYLFLYTSWNSIDVREACIWKTERRVEIFYRDERLPTHGQRWSESGSQGAWVGIPLCGLPCIHSSTHPCNTSLCSAYQVPETVLGSWDMAKHKADEKYMFSWSLHTGCVDRWWADNCVSGVISGLKSIKGGQVI